MRGRMKDECKRQWRRFRSLPAETLTPERTLSDLVNPACSLTPAKIALMWQTAPPRMPIARPGTLMGFCPFRPQ
jgi:hypothetical protein